MVGNLALDSIFVYFLKVYDRNFNVFLLNVHWVDVLRCAAPHPSQLYSVADAAIARVSAIRIKGLRHAVVVKVLLLVIH